MGGSADEKPPASGEKISVVETALAPLKPPAISTSPEGRSVAVCRERPATIEPTCEKPWPGK
jgi:hypothetical protein